MIILLILLFLITGFMPFIGIIITEKINSEFEFLGGFITGIIESLLLFFFIFIISKNLTGGI